MNLMNTKDMTNNLIVEDCEYKLELDQDQTFSSSINTEISEHSGKDSQPTHNLWGQHLVLDLGGCNDNILTKQDIANFVNELVKAIDMVAYGEPQIVHFAKHSYEAAGYSLVQLIETSAIMGHFSDNTRQAYLDIFSCKTFDNQTVIEVVKKHFEPCKIKSICLDRGIDL